MTKIMTVAPILHVLLLQRSQKKYGLKYYIIIFRNPYQNDQETFSGSSFLLNIFVH